MVNKKKRKLAFASLGMAAVLAVGATYSFFTDRVDTSAIGRAGTVDIDLISDVRLTNEDEQNILDPGEGCTVNFSIPNNGSKSVDIKEIIKLSCSIPMTETETQAEFELYKTTDVYQDENGAYFPNVGATPLSEREVSADKKTITYNIPVVTLDGNHGTPSGEYESEAEAEGRNTCVEEYTLIFRKSASSDFMDGTVTLEKLVDAKQHRNTMADWSNIVFEKYIFHNSDELI